MRVQAAEVSASKVRNSRILHMTTDIQAAFSKIATTVGSNANLNRIGLGLGLERFIAGSHGGNTIADTMEAILGGSIATSRR